MKGTDFGPGEEKMPEKEGEAIIIEGELPQAIVINEVQLLLAEKRTTLAMLRTGITVFVIPMSVLSLLVVTSRYYDLRQVMQFTVPLLLINAALLALGGYLVVHSVVRLHREDQRIRELKNKNVILSRLVD